MKKLKSRFVYLPLLLLWLWMDRCDGLVDSSLPQIFYPFGSDEGDNIVTPGDDCIGYISIPYEIFDSRSLYVSSCNTKEIEFDLLKFLLYINLHVLCLSKPAVMFI